MRPMPYPVYQIASPKKKSERIRSRASNNRVIKYHHHQRDASCLARWTRLTNYRKTIVYIAISARPIRVTEADQKQDGRPLSIREKTYQRRGKGERPKKSQYRSLIRTRVPNLGPTARPLPTKCFVPKVMENTK